MDLFKTVVNVRCHWYKIVAEALLLEVLQGSSYSQLSANSRVHQITFEQYLECCSLFLVVFSFFL